MRCQRVGVVMGPAGDLPLKNAHHGKHLKISMLQDMITNKRYYLIIELHVDKRMADGISCLEFPTKTR